MTSNADSAPEAASFVRTVLGDLPPERLGVCDAHEHAAIAESYATERFPEFRHDDFPKLCAELRGFREAGGSALIDAMPCACGRDISLLAALSRETGVSIVAATGVHLAQYYPTRHWTSRYGADQLAALMVADIEQGIDRFDYGGPIVERAPHRAGVIKAAGSGPRLGERDRRVFAAAAEAQRQTGCPILTHTEQGEGGLAQAAFLRDCGADLSRVVLSHTDRRPDPARHRDLLQTGVRLEYDGAFRWKRPDGRNPTLELLLELAPEFPDQLMLGMDMARASYWSAYGGLPGLRYLLDVFAPQLRQASLSEALLDRLLRGNPAAAFSFAPSLQTETSN